MRINNKVCISKFLIGVLLLVSNISFGQSSILDSLQTELHKHLKADSTKVNLLNAIINAVYDTDINKAEDLIQKSKNLADKLNLKKGKADVIYYKGHIELNKSNYANQALERYKYLNYKPGISYSINCIGIAYYQRDFSKALEYYKKAYI